MTSQALLPQVRGLRAAICVCVVLGLTGVVWAQNPPAAEAKKPQGETGYQAASSTGAVVTPLPTFKPGEEPVIVFEKTQVDLGTIPEGQKGTFTFPFKNAGKSDLEILEVQKTCGCTRAETTKTTLKPGESAEIEGDLDTTHRSGKQVKTIHVKSNDPKNPDTTLRFEATIQKQVDVQPPSVHFAGLDLGETGKQELKITNLTDKPMKVLGIDSSDEERVKVALLSPLAEEGKEGESAPVMGEDQPVLAEVTVEPRQEMGSFNAMVTILTDSPAKPKIQVSVYGRVSGDLEVYPANLFFGVVRDAAPTTRTVTISSRSGLPFKITKLETEGVPLKVSQEPLESKEGYRLKVGIDGELETLRNSGKIHLETTHPKQKDVDINVTAWVRK